MVDAGLITADKSAALPLKKVSVIAEVKGYLFGLQASLFYQNDSSDPVEVLFRLPLERSTAVVGLTAVIDGRKITAQLQDKQKARDKYDDAIASGKTAALGEESSGDIFSISLGSLHEGGEAEIQLKMVGEMPIDAEGGVRFSLPATLKPRYTPAGSTDPLAPVEGDSEQVVRGKIKGVHQFELRVLDAEQISSIVSPTHSIVVSREDTLINVTLSDSASLHQDLVVLITHKEPHKPKVLVEPGLLLEKDKQPSFLNHLAVMVNFFPEIPSVECSNEFIFLVDRSGSMSGSFIRSASEALVLFLKSLPEDCYFNIYGFGTTFKGLFSSSVPYNQQNLDTATQHAQQLKADLGGTELLPPLRHIFEQPLVKGKQRQIFVLTDGEVSNTDACISQVKKNSSKARCFTFGIGSGASTELVEGLATAGKGSAEFVKDGERLHPKVVRSLKNSMQPGVNSISVKFQVPKYDCVYEIPEVISSVFSGEKFVAYGIFKPSTGRKMQDLVQGKATLKYTLLGKGHQIDIPFAVKKGAACSSTIHHLAAKQRLLEWERSGSLEMVNLSIESGVVCSHTAFVAVDEETKAPISAPLKTYDLLMVEEDNLFDSIPMSFGFRSMASNFSSDEDEEDDDLCEMSVNTAPKLRNISPVELDVVPMRSSIVDECLPLQSARPKLPNTQPLVSKSLSSLVALQQANGSWSLTTDLATQLSKEMRLIEDSCPSGCPTSVWATALALSTLKLTYSSQQNEWELVAKKAESWLRKQTLPSHLSIQDLHSEAEKFL